jgi:hypothetical protein
MRLLPLLLVACNATVVDEYEICSLEVTLEPASGAPGATIVVTGTPFTEVRDTRVEVGGVRAEVSLVLRADRNVCEDFVCVTSEDCGGCSDEATCEDGQCVAPPSDYYCGLCDLCRADAGCAPCGICEGLEFEPSVRTECFGDPLGATPVLGACDQCVETIEFVVPQVPAGLTSVLVLNRNGQSEATPFEVLPGPDPTGDTGDTETGDTETGAPPTGDTGDTDETGDTDTGDTDTGDTVTNTAETAETADTGTSDTGTPDTGTPDTGTSDTSDTGL